MKRKHTKERRASLAGDDEWSCWWLSLLRTIVYLAKDNGHVMYKCKLRDDQRRVTN